ncbi:Ubiquitin domain-containing protein DSK2b [Gracilariopsis chorda]|uniref:Ubiquitin domain-containing protein DSK2b n=1 Tax=Gracilariopsis chorda TaxID=448386 RepID=A0A2V3IFR1_9FLOR|nr:Ubiquitin domain-containing protein DSK2b [Gracilariopsis chorda]|eukprot:PXF40926.1 Ubiquitin domain-containing protein DSK2b [Gracilariopsis chorda]
MAITIIVKNTGGTRFEMEVADFSETVGQFKTRLASVSGIPANSQRLIFRGHILKDSHTFEQIRAKHGLESGHSMHVVPSPSARTTPSSAPTARTTPATTSANPTPQPNGNPAPNPPANNMDPFGTGAFGMPGMPGMPGMGDMRQMLRNPQQMEALLNSPIMDGIMNNPEIARNMMMNTPQMRELMERNPEIAHIFNDPSTFRQMVQMARNPALMNEMMRNTDRQMANIEMMPGGFDTLRRMHENIQAPLMDAAQDHFTNNATSNEAGNGTDDNPFSSLFQNTPSNAPMPNPWAPNGGMPAQNPSTNGWGGAGADAAGANLFASLFSGAPDTNGSSNAATAGGGANPVPPFNMAAGMNSEHMLRLLENPAMLQFMQSILSDPQMFQTMVAGNPQLQALQQSNPEMARMLQNPELVRAFLNPDVMRAVRQMHDAMNPNGANAGSLFGLNPTAPDAGTTGTRATSNATAANAGTGTSRTPSQQAASGQQSGENGANRTGAGAQHPFAALMNALNAGGMGGGAQQGTQTGANAAGAAQNPFAAMMNALNAGGMGGAATTNSTQEMTQEQLEEMYSTQLEQLRDMGFLDKTMCLQALQQSQGNVSAAIENLLSRFGG